MKISLEKLSVGNLANIQIFLSYLYPLEFLWLLINWYRLCSDVMSYEMYARNNSFWGFLCIRDARLRGNKITDNLKETGLLICLTIQVTVVRR